MIGESNNSFSWWLKFVMIVVRLGQVEVNSTFNYFVCIYNREVYAWFFYVATYSYSKLRHLLP